MGSLFPKPEKMSIKLWNSKQKYDLKSSPQQIANYSIISDCAHFLQLNNIDSPFYEMQNVAE